MTASPPHISSSMTYWSYTSLSTASITFSLIPCTVRSSFSVSDFLEERLIFLVRFNLAGSHLQLVDLVIDIFQCPLFLAFLFFESIILLFYPVQHILTVLKGA